MLRLAEYFAAENQPPQRSIVDDFEQNRTYWNQWYHKPAVQMMAMQILGAMAELSADYANAVPFNTLADRLNIPANDRDFHVDNVSSFREALHFLTLNIRFHKSDGKRAKRSRSVTPYLGWIGNGNLRFIGRLD